MSNYVGREPNAVNVLGDYSPIGAIIFAHVVPDATWLQMNGQAVSKTMYPDLWAYAQGALTADQVANPGLYRSVDASSFAVPKLDGLFIRATGQVDAQHVAAALGVKQIDTVGPADAARLQSNSFGSPGSIQFSTNAGTGHGSFPPSAETRPVNVALVPCVKALKTVFALLPQGVVAASQSEMEAAAALDRFVAPGSQKFHPGSAKAWLKFQISGALLVASYNVASVVRTAAGTFDVTFTTPFSSAAYAATVSPEAATQMTGQLLGSAPVPTAGGCRIIIHSAGASADPVNFSAAFFGDQ